MRTEREMQLVQVLTSVVAELKNLQATGRMRDSESRAHVDFLERQLRAAEERVACRRDRGRRAEWWAPGNFDGRTLS